MKKLVLIAMLCALFLGVQAQQKDEKPVPPPPHCEKDCHHPCDQKECQTMMKLRRDFIKENFQLPEAQVKAFWAAYDEMESAEFQIMKDAQKKKEEAGLKKRVSPDSIQFLTDEQILTLYSVRMESKAQMAQVATKFFNALTKCLTPVQIDQYYQLEKKFKHSAVNKAKEKKMISLPEKQKFPVQEPMKKVVPVEKLK